MFTATKVVDLGKIRRAVMFIAGLILTVLAYLGGGAVIVVGVIDPYVLYSSGSVAECIVTGVIIFVALGFVGHIFATKAVIANRKGGTLAVFWISLLPYVIPTIVIMLLVAILRIFDQIMYIITDKHIVAQVVNTITESLFGRQLKVFSGAGTLSDDNTASDTVYSVYNNGFNRLLTPVGTKQDHDPDSIYYMKHYTYFRDDLGNYWRSYDGNNTFIAEYDIEHKNALK